MKIMRKIAMLLLAVMLIGTFAACNRGGGGGGNTNPAGDGDYTKLTGEVRFILPGDAEPADADTVTAAINAALKEDGRNYTVSFEYESWANYWNRLGLIANEGYDACWMHADYLASFYGQRILKPLDAFVDAYGETLKETTPDVYWNTAKVAGELYAIPRVAPLSESNTVFTVRGDWMEEYGMTEITTLEQLDTYLSKTYDKLSSVEGAYVMDKDHSDYLRREYSKNYYFPLGSFSKYPVYIDMSQKIDGKYLVQSYYESDAFKNTVIKANEYFKAHYKRSSRSSLDANLMDASFNAGLLGFNWSTPQKITERIDAFKQEQPDGELYEGMLNPDETRWIVKGENSIACFANSSKTEHVIDFLSWMREDQANFDLVAYGIEGENYNLTEDGRLDLSEIPDDKNYSAIFPAFAFSTTDNIRYSAAVSDSEIERMSNWDTGENVKVSPLIGFAPEYRGIFNTAYAQVSAIEMQYSEDFMYGLYDITTGEGKTRYDTFISTLKANGLDTLISELQKQVDEFVAENNL